MIHNHHNHNMDYIHLLDLHTSIFVLDLLVAPEVVEVEDLVAKVD